MGDRSRYQAPGARPQSLGADVEAAHLRALWFHGRGADVRTAGTIGGGRNWDYRYSWIRDSSFTLYALMRLGYTHEAAAFMRWLESRCKHLRPDGSLQLMYRIDGSEDLPELILDHFEGYCSRLPCASATTRICSCNSISMAS